MRQRRYRQTFCFADPASEAGISSRAVEHSYVFKTPLEDLLEYVHQSSNRSFCTVILLRPLAIAVWGLFSDVDPYPERKLYRSLDSIHMCTIKNVVEISRHKWWINLLHQEDILHHILACSNIFSALSDLAVSARGLVSLQIQFGPSQNICGFCWAMSRDLFPQKWELVFACFLSWPNSPNKERDRHCLPLYIDSACFWICWVKRIVQNKEGLLHAALAYVLTTARRCSEIPASTKCVCSCM